MPKTPGDLLGQRALNRALLERQLLLKRVPLDVTGAIEQLVGLQAQVPSCPYVSLWSRLDGFAFDQLGDLVEKRGVVRAVLMRGTIHLVSAADALQLWPPMRPVLEQVVYPNATYGKDKLDGLHMPDVLAAGRELLAQEPRTAAQLRELLAPQWPEHDPAALAYAVRVLLPLVHVPPRGIYGRSGPIAFAPMDVWLGAEPSSDATADGLVLRYLAAFGPATPADAQTWSGLRGLREVLERLRPRLRVFRAGASCSTCRAPRGRTPRRPRRRGCCRSSTTCCCPTPTGPESSGTTTARRSNPATACCPGRSWSTASCAAAGRCSVRRTPRRSV